MNATTPAIQIQDLWHRYGDRTALAGLTLSMERGEAFALLGPNGGGKTTLFRVLSTLIRLQQGSVRILGCDLATEAALIRQRLGVVFQAASLDRKLTVVENIRCQAALYGLHGRVLREREAELMNQLGLSDRAAERTESLSGGLRRRVELAKGMIHRPELLLLDEPSTGLDPGARADLWNYLGRLRDQFGVTVVVTTHLLDEAERADRIGILHQGQLVAVDTPDRLRASVGGDAIMIETSEAERLAEEIRTTFEVAASVVDGRVRLELPDGHRWITKLVEAFPDRIASVSVGKPTLEDVFIDKTGHRFWSGGEHGDDA